MFNRIYFSLICILVLLSIAYANENRELSELSKLKAENFKLRTQLVQCSIKVQDTSLASEQAQLIDQFRKELNADNEQVFDWNSLTFNSKSK